MSAPFEADGWDRALRSVASQTGSARGQLIAIGGPRTVPLNWITDVANDLTDEFVAIDGGDPKRNWRVACTGAPFEIVGEDGYAAARSRDPKAFAAYDELMDRNRMMNGCQTVLSNDGSALLGFAVLRTDQDGPTTQEQRETFAALAPFALTAVQMQRAIEHQGAALIKGALEAIRSIAFICDGRGRVGALTASAEEWLGRVGRLTAAGSRLMARSPAEDRELQAAFKRAIDGDGEIPRGSQFWLRGDDEPATSQRCEVFPLPRRDWSFGFEPRVLVVVREAAALDEREQGALQALLDLTAAEADVALLVAQGVPRDRIASRRGTTPDTVHAQMKSLYRKADVAREAELVALLNRLVR